ncbi:MAG: 3-oxoacid CoA-transferase [Elusimicrobia bacterium]|nr:3-oxoacid CoA-transferase [Elusimicrobiota bacterium]
MSAQAEELLVAAAARLMTGRSTVFIGTGLPMLAAALAKRTCAPELVCVFEFGGIGPALERLPRAVGESRSFERAWAAEGLAGVMETAQRGLIMDGFLGGAQVDPYGNLNTTVIGPHDAPRARLPGAGGANDVGSLVWRTVIMMRHERRRFVEKVDFVTTPGYLDGPGARERAGLCPGTGPYRLLTDLALFDFPAETRRARLIALQPGATLEGVRAETGFAFEAVPEPETLPPPTPEELAVLRAAAGMEAAA